MTCKIQLVGSDFWQLDLDFRGQEVRVEIGVRGGVGYLKSLSVN